MCDHYCCANAVGQRDCLLQAAQRVARPAGHESLEWVVDSSDRQAGVCADPAEISWLAAIPALVGQDFDGVKAGLGGQFEDTGNSIGKEGTG
jgi:hypothetical protein